MSDMYYIDSSTYPMDANAATGASMYQPQQAQQYPSGMTIPVPSSSLGYAPVAPTTRRMSNTSSMSHPNMPHRSRRYSPDHLIGLEDPTQPRRYITPSSTSRKDIPSIYLKNRRTSQPSDEEDDELTEEQPPLANATDQEKIEWKRRQNTLAARRSRRKKAMYTQQLEETVERLRIEREMWRTRALTLKQLLSSHGLPVPDFKD